MLGISAHIRLAHLATGCASYRSQFGMFFKFFLYFVAIVVRIDVIPMVTMVYAYAAVD